MSIKAILAVGLMTLLVAGCGGNSDPASGNSGSAAPDSTSSDASTEAAEADTSPPPDNYVGQPEPSLSADDNHPQVQWKSQAFAKASPE